VLEDHIKKCEQEGNFAEA
jgi:Fe2+ transport system protein B